jgi:hypothetical protein
MERAMDRGMTAAIADAIIHALALPRVGWKLSGQLSVWTSTSDLSMIGVNEILWPTDKEIASIRRTVSGRD